MTAFFEFRIERTQIRLGLPARDPVRDFPQRPTHRGHQPSEPVLQHEVSRAILQQLDRGFLADGSRDDDDRSVRAALHGKRKGLRAVEGRQSEIGQDQFRAKLSDFLLEFSAGLHAPRHKADSALPQFARDQLRIDFGILEKENSKAGIGG